MNQNYITKRGNKYYYRRRVPEEVSHLDTRNEVKVSLKTEEFEKAIIKASLYNEHVENFWKSLIQSGNSDNIQKRYKTAIQIAKSYGYTYKNSEQIAASQLNEIIGRLSNNPKSDPNKAALLGGIDEPIISLSECWQLYCPLVVDRLVNKSEHKIKKWKTPRETALKDFIKVVGDVSIIAVDREIILSFRRWLNERIINGLSGDAANKKLRFVKDILKTVSLNANIDIDYDIMFVKTRFTYVVNSRLPYEASYIQNKLLTQLDGLNERDKMALFAMADTGARETEIFGLLPEEIRLNTNIPHIIIQPRKGYELKTKSSERMIPLVGTALHAFQQFPDGFEHKGNPDAFSNNVNNYLKEQNLRPTLRHSAYSLRHTFKDRLRDAEAPEEIIDELMGHRKLGPNYGRGRKLEAKQKYLLKIAYLLPKELKS